VFKSSEPEIKKQLYTPQQRGPWAYSPKGLFVIISSPERISEKDWFELYSKRALLNFSTEASFRPLFKATPILTGEETEKYTLALTR